jgi:glycine hydroxymethyltransferase
MIAAVLDGVAQHGPDGDSAVSARIKEEAVALCQRFPIYN